MVVMASAASSLGFAILRLRALALSRDMRFLADTIFFLDGSRSIFAELCSISKHVLRFLLLLLVEGVVQAKKKTPFAFVEQALQ